jgi:hypothetical protein
MNFRDALILPALLLGSSVAVAQAVIIPIPAQLATAQTVFIANAGGPDNTLSQFAYKSFYHAIGKRFRVVTRPADADLSFELATTYSVGAKLTARTAVLQLSIRDAKTQSLLWSFSEPVISEGTASISEMDKAANKLLEDYNALVDARLVYEPAPRRFSDEGKK